MGGSAIINSSESLSSFFDGDSFAAAAIGFELGVTADTEGKTEADTDTGTGTDNESETETADTSDTDTEDDSESEDTLTDDSISEDVTIILPDSDSETETESDTEEESDNSILELLENLVSADLTDFDASEIEINNDTSLVVDTAAYISEELDITLSESKPCILIIHTHTSEAYTPTEENDYTPTDPSRTEDSDYNVVRVGNVIEELLTEAGLCVIHDTELYDYPSYSGCYARSLEAIENYLEEYPTIQVVLDIHRDSVENDDGNEITSTLEINGETSAQVMIVVGTGEGGLSHPYWESNFSLALRLQAVMDINYPGLARAVNLRSERFNQHATSGSLLIEIGYAGNTLEEALVAAKYFAQCAAAVFLELEAT